MNDKLTIGVYLPDGNFYKFANDHNRDIMVIDKDDNIDIFDEHELLDTNEFYRKFYLDNISNKDIYK